MTLTEAAKATQDRCKAKRLADMRSNPYDRAHGTSTGYKYGCRCIYCKVAESERKRAEYARHPKRIQKRVKRYYEAHREERKAYAREYYRKLKGASC